MIRSDLPLAALLAALLAAPLATVFVPAPAEAQQVPAPAATPQYKPQLLAQTPYFALYEALGKPAGWKIYGTVRPRYEQLDGQFRPAPAPARNDLFSLQTTLFAEYDAGPARFGFEVFDSRAYFQRRGSNSISTLEVNALELGQAYIGLDMEDIVGAGTVSTLTAGRFTQNVGSRRLVARNQFRNTINAFTGVAYNLVNADKDRLYAFYTLPHYREPDDRRSILSNSVEFDVESTDLQFYGASYTKTGILGGTAEIYGYGLNERDTPVSGSQLAGIPTRNRQLFTPGFRLFQLPVPGLLDHDIEAIYQTGRARETTAATDLRDLPVSAYFVHASFGYMFNLPWTPRLSLEYDQASGDGSNPNTYNRFDTLFGARRFDYGPTSLYGPVQRTNLISPGVRLEIFPDPLWDAFIDYRALFLEDPTDSFAATNIRDRTGNSGRFAGQQIEARFRYWVLPGSIQIDTGAAYLIKGDFLRNAPNAPQTGDTVYGYFQTTFFF